MNFGQGSIGFVNKVPAPAPATVTAADNGLSLDGTTVQLGQDVGAVGDPAQLLNNREIPLSGFSIDWLGNLVSESIDDSTGLYQILSGAVPQLYIDAVNKQYLLGNIAGGNNSRITIDDALQLFQFEVGIGNQFLYVDPTNSTYWLGDIPGAIDETFLYLDSNSFEVDIVSDRYLTIERAQDRYMIGDLDNNATGIHFAIRGTTNQFSLDNAAHNTAVSINGVVGFTGTVTPVNSITVNGGIVTAVS